MKNKLAITLVFFATIGVTLFYIFISGKRQVEVVKEQAALVDSVATLECAKKEAEQKVNSVDSLAKLQWKLIEDQKKQILALDEETKVLKAAPKSVKSIKPEVIYIHDTVFITEKKNFWGKTRKSVTTSQSIDSVFIEEVDTLLNE